MLRFVEAGALVGLLVGCSKEVLFIDSEQAKSLIVASKVGGEWSLEAKVIGGERSAQLTSNDPLYLLLYDRPLSELDLTPGPVPLGTPGRMLPVPDRGFVVDETGSIPLVELPAELADVRIARDELCYTFEIGEQGTIDGADTLYFAAAIDDRVLLSTDAGFYWANADAIAPATDLPADLPREAGFWHEASRELWLVDSGGRVMHGDPSAGFTEGPALPNLDGTPIFLDGSRGDAPLELYAVTSSRALHRFDGTTWEMRSPPRGFITYISRYQVAWIAPHRAVALSTYIDRVLEDDGSAVFDVFIPELDTGATQDSLRTAHFVGGYGAMLATDHGSLYSRDSSGWQLLHRAESRTESLFIEPLGVDGVIYGGEDGVLAQYQPEEYCPSFSLSARADAAIIAWLSFGERPLAIYRAEGGLVWVRADP